MLFFFIIFFIYSCSTSNKFDRPVESFVAPFSDGKFQNLEPFPDKSFSDFYRWKWTDSHKSRPWPERKSTQQFKPEQLRSKNPIITIINHASVLVQMNDLNILLDPHYSERCSPVSFAGPKRVVDPGIKFDDLPKIDIVLISHNHYDHLDLETLKRISKRDNPIFYAGLGTASFLKDNSIKNSFDLDW